MLPHLQLLLWAGQPNRSPLQIFDSDALHSKSEPTSRARLHHWTCGCPRTELGTIGRERVPCGLGASPLAEINLSILTQRHNLGSIWALARQYRRRPRRTWLHGKQASAFGRSARERHHGPRWEQKNAAHCCQQTARHTTSSYRASWITAPLGNSGCSIIVPVNVYFYVGTCLQRHNRQFCLVTFPEFNQFPATSHHELNLQFFQTVQGSG